MASLKLYPVIAAVVLVVAIVAVGSALAFGLLGTGNAASTITAVTPLPTATPRSAALLAAPTAPARSIGSIADTITLSIEPHYIVYGAGALWAYGNNNNTLVRIDPQSSRVLAEIPLDRGALEAVAMADAVWVTLDGGSLIKVDPATNKVASLLHLEKGGEGVADADGSVWVDSSGSGTVTRIDPQTNHVVATIPLHDPTLKSISEPNWSSIVAAGGELWATDDTQHTIVRIDTKTNKVADTIPVGAAVDEMSSAAGDLWLSSMPDNKVLRFNLATKKVTASFDATSPNYTLATAKAVWVSLPYTGELMRIDPGTNRVLGTLATFGIPGGAVDLDGALWLALGGQNAISKVVPAP